jgi:DNA-binding CsgD family transcriptional regulator
MTIPEIRAELRALAEEYDIPRLAELAEETKRRPAKRRSPSRLAALTPTEKREVREFVAANDDISYKEIANRFGTSIGRVSEAVAGYRT